MRIHIRIKLGVIPTLVTVMARILMMKQSFETTVIPKRHGADLAAGRRIARPVRWLTRDDPTPSEQRWQALGEALMRGDPPMDRMVEWMLDYGMREGRALFQQALDHGIENVADAPEPLCALFAVIDRRPAWADDDLLMRGTQASHLAGMAGLYALRDASLMGGYQASAINKTLVLTGSLANGPQRRLAETTKWWIDCTEPGGLQRFGEGFKSTLHVRLIHSLIRRRVQRMPEWDNSEWGLPVNQTDMAATQLAFSVIFLLGSRALGVPLTPSDGRAVMHLWRTIGWLIGIDERWLPETEQHGRELLYQILLSQAPPDDSSRQLGRALMDEPLHRSYPNFAGLRGRFERARHLSIARLFLDAQSMSDLGLPSGVLPWYPAISAPLNFARHGTHRLLPGGRRRLVRTGRKAQVDYLKILFGQVRPAILTPVAE